MDNPIISIITPYYNCQDYIDETAKSVLSQTFENFEWIIVDDGSSKQSVLKLKQIGKLDKRIKIFFRENAGPAVARDFGIEKSAKSAKYIVFLDADDLYEKTYLECCYWTLETHKGASWAYTDSINFGARNFLWRKWYDVEWEKEENLLIVSACIRKEDLLEVQGFGVKEKKVYEDWYLWLKLIKAGKYPVRMNSLLTYYRQKEDESELKDSNTRNRKNALKLVNEVKKDIVKYKDAIQFPKYDYNWDKIIDEQIEYAELKKIENKRMKQNMNYADLDKIKDDDMKCTNLDKIKDDDMKCTNLDKINVLMIIPWMVTGGADRFNLSLVCKMDKTKFDFTIITTLPQKNEWRKYFEKYATVYDLTTFLDMKDWVSFINYIIKKNNINLIFNSNSQFGYKILPYLKSRYPNIPIVDFVHMEEWYLRSGGFSRDSSMMQSVIDKTFTCNENSRNVFIKYFGKARKEVRTVHIGVDEKKFDPEKVLGEDIEFGFSVSLQGRRNIEWLSLKEVLQNKKVISYICRIADQKRPYLFFEICKKLHEIRDDFAVVVVGDGPFLEGLKNRVKQNKLEDIFYFTGEIKAPEKIYKISDLTINTSIKEGIALTSYESLSMGVPVVSSDVGGQRELITDEVGAVVPCIQDETEILNFDYTKEEVQGYVDAICKILDNLEYYKSNCRKRILKCFTIDKMIKKMEKEFEKIVRNPNEKKIQNGIILSKNMDILKELISTYFASSKPEYDWLVHEFNEKNVHVLEKYDKKAKKMMYYEHTLEYKIKHPIVVALRKLGIYEQLRSFFI